jgi:aspartate-semialdehyde dehydrogenase
MKLSNPGKRVAVVGASSLLGKDLLSQLEEAPFPISRLISLEQEEDDETESLPILDIQPSSHQAVSQESLRAEDVDIIFVAAIPHRIPDFLRSTLVEGSAGGDHQPSVIDLSGGLAHQDHEVLRIPFLDRSVYSASPKRALSSHLLVSPHAAAIVLSTLLLRLAARSTIERAVAQVFCPASEIGPRAIEELQNQAVSLMSFRDVPQKVYGGQLAFNLLPRLTGGHAGAAQELEGRIRRQLLNYLDGRAPLPALRVFQAPIFYSLAFSLYVETAKVTGPEAAGAALAGKPVRVRRASEKAPSPMEVAGTSDILVDAVIPDPGRTSGFWIWAAADNLRLAASNALAIAENLD